MSTINAKQLTAAVGIAAAVALLGAGTASASPLPAPAAPVGSPAITDNYSITDATPFDLTLTAATQTRGPYGPDNGWFAGEYPSESTVTPGYGSTWGITSWGWEGDLPWSVSYRFTDAGSNVDTVTMSSTGGSSPVENCSISGPTAGDWTCSTNGNQVNLHATNATMNLSQADRSAFAQALSNVCSSSSGNGASCTFLPTSPVTYAESATGFVPKGANTEPGCFAAGDPRDTYTYTGSGETSQTTSFSDSMSETASVGVEGVANFGVEHTSGYGQEFSSGTSYSDSYQITAGYGYKATPFWIPTVASVTGNFTATIGGTTYDLNDVTLQTSGVAGSSGGQNFGNATATTHQQPMTHAEWTENCGSATPPPVVH